MSKKKLIAVAIILALILLIGGLLAYFTDTDTETNVFTLGKVDIEITEDWEPEDGEDVIPGQEIDKAPSVANQSDSEKAFVFVEVTVPCYKSVPATGAFDTPMFTYTVNGDWAEINTPASIDTTTGTIKHVYAYGTSSAMTELNPGATTASAVFDTVTVDPNMTNSQAATALTTDIVIDAVGIQSEYLGSTTTPAAIYSLAKASS